MDCFCQPNEFSECLEKSKENSMSRLFRPITTLCMCLTSLFWACHPGIAGAYHQSGRQALNHGELVPASILPHNPIGIDTRTFGGVSKSIEATPEPVSLALFGSGLTLVGVVLLRCSRRTKSSSGTWDAHCAFDNSCARLTGDVNGVQYSRSRIPTPDRFVTTYMSSGSK